jgi:antitoxin VapB
MPAKGPARSVIDPIVRYRYCIYVKTAKLFRSGGSQAVRLPKEFRFDCSEVYVQQEGDRVILMPKGKRSWPSGFFRAIKIKDPSFKRPEQPPLPPTKPLT